MAKYRREIVENDLKNIHDQFKDHLDADGGVFTEDKRRKLLGVKAQAKKNYQEDNAEFWYDVRTTVRSGLKDLELFCFVAHPEQVKEIFDHRLVSGKCFVPSPLVDVLSALFGNFPISNYKKINENRAFDLWKAPLAYEIVKIVIEYLRKEDLITSLAHKRVAEEFLDMMAVEIGQKGQPVIR
ncbi:MAG: hypothetical protein ACREA3_10125 [Nitrosotalea sp.]